MTFQILAALALFALVSSITPGPNNLMLLASGANFGVLRTLPHMLGISLGMVVMVLLLGAGLMQAFEVWPGLHLTLKLASVAYMAWLAWKIAHAAPPPRAGEGIGEGATTGVGGTERSGGAEEEAATGRPMTLLQAMGFQWVNPKAWAMITAALAGYAPAGDFRGVIVVAAAFMLVGFPSISCWAVLGRQMRRLLTSPRRLAVFNWTMAALLLASLWPMLAG
ncbi:LysE family translocator [Acidimangrovimonas sediminis]|uniref:LysE family translocator n=1 Tax=Acidimangrovimonas sediminis TaxID=2056283 RepID=UPI000C80873C|nr:LysE family translocator [Acidimangrovimonas sediminis]